MRFEDYLKVQENGDIDNIISEIERNCKPFIDDWKKLNISKWLMSGRRIMGSPMFKKGTVRVDRVPVDTPIELHDLVDTWFNNKFGFKARSNAIFTTFNPNMTYRYGDLYLIFPIGQYSVVSSKKVEDLYLIIEEVIFAILDGYHSDLSRLWKRLTDENKKRAKLSILEELNKSGYMDKLVFHNNEIMLNCKEYYIVSSKYNAKLLEYFGK